MSKMNKLAQTLAKRPIICAEGYLFELERRGWVQVGPFVPEVVLKDPTAVKQLHREFVRAGSDVIQCFTYYGHREKMKLIGKEDETIKLNKKAIEIAFEVKNEFEFKNDLLIAGNICNSTIFDLNNKDIQTKIYDQYCEQVELCAEYNVDYMIGETFEYLGEALIALNVFKKFNLPSVITFSTLKTKTFDNYELYEACQILTENGCDVVGLNCSRGPETLMPLLKEIKLNCPEIKNIAALPVCYRTNNKYPIMQSLGGFNEKYLELDSHTCTRGDLANFAKECIEMNINYIVTCCGGAPHHIRSMSEAIGRTPISSQYSPKLSKHFLFGDDNEENLNQKEYLEFGKTI